MPTQFALSFDAVPIACEVQQRYHSIAPCLAGVSTPDEQAQALNLDYSTITCWLHEFRESANRRLGNHHEMYEKGHSWQNLIESQIGI